MLCCLSWLCSTWKSIRDWIGENKFLTVVQVVAVGLLFFGVEMVYRHRGWIVTESGSTIIRNLGLVIGGLIAIGFGIWRGVVASRQAETSQLGLLNERYQKAAEMLGSEVLSVRLGGIYALQRLGEDHAERYHVQIMRLLCAFVRNPHEKKDRDNRARPEVNEKRGQRNIRSRVKALMVPGDVQAALEAIGDRSAADVELERKEKFEPDLSGAQLSGLDLSKRKANQSGIDLSDVVFTPPDLRQLNLDTEEFLFQTGPIHAILSGVDLRCARLVEANVTEADVTGADLSNADLSGAVLSKARGLTQCQLDQAIANPADPPELDSLCDPETGEALKWRGRESCRKRHRMLRRTPRKRLEDL